MAALALELPPGVEQQGRPGVQAGGVELEQDPVCRLRPPERVDVPETAAALFQIGLQPERDLAHALMASRDAGGELREPLLRATLPARERPRGEAGGQRALAGDVPGAQ